MITARIKQIAAGVLLALIATIVLSPIGLVYAETAEVSSLLSSMTTEDKICQMLVLNFGAATDSSGHQVLSGAARQELERHCFGGVLFDAQSTADNEDTVRLVDSIQTANASGGAFRPQLLFAADQEGGSITRIGHGTQTPGNMALGAINDDAAARSVGSLIGSELKALGISVDFAPVLDVNSNPSNPVIGIRSFSDSAWMTASLGVSYMSGLMSTGTVACLKHFPGHGDTATDSHTGLPSIDKSYSQLQGNELIPFKSAINAGAEMIMTAHIQFPQIETETYNSPISGQTITLPATLSKRIISGILREDMGFRGVVITDGMMMDALTAHFRPLEASRLAIEAGVDLLLSPVSPYNSSGITALENLISSLTAMAETGQLSISKIDAAVTRILNLKQRHGLLNRYDNSDLAARIRNAVQTVGSDAHHAAEWEITKRAITLVKNDGGALPLIRTNEKTVILTASQSEILSAEYAKALLQSHGKLVSGSTVRIYTYDGQSYESLCAKIADADNVIAISEVKSASGLRSSKAQLISSLIDYVHSKGNRFIVLSAHLPYDAARFTTADAMMLAYSSKSMNEDPRVTEGTVAQYGPNIPAALYMMFSAVDSPSAHMPVNIPRLSSSYYYTNETLYARGFGLTYASSPVQPTPSPAETPTAPELSDEPLTVDPAFTELPFDDPTEFPSDEPTEEVTGQPETELPTEQANSSEPSDADGTEQPEHEPVNTTDPAEPTQAPIGPSPGPKRSLSPAVWGPIAACILAVLCTATAFIIRKK